MIGRWLFGVLAMVAGVPAGAQAPDSVRLVLKFVKSDGARAGPAARFDPASCLACVLDTEPGYSADNLRETIIALRVPPMRQLELSFDKASRRIRRVIVEGADIPFTQKETNIVARIAPLARDAITAGEYAMHIVEPGMVLRLEHADPLRRAGAYAAGPFPTTERQAATTLEFAQREVIRELGLGTHVARDGLGTIEVMGFDINDPHGHTDAPAHMHMHLRWPQDTGTQIGHYYISPDSLLVRNIVSIKGMSAPQRVFERGMTFTTIGPDGRAVYAHTITREGWLLLGTAGTQPCSIRPIAGGFQSGARVACPGRAKFDVTVIDDLPNAIVSVHAGPFVEQFRYDIDTGALISPSTMPAPPPSVYQSPDGHLKDFSTNSAEPMEGNAGVNQISGRTRRPLSMPPVFGRNVRGVLIYRW